MSTLEYLFGNWYTAPIVAVFLGIGAFIVVYMVIIEPILIIVRAIKKDDKGKS